MSTQEPTKCAFDDKPLTPEDNGICPECWKAIRRPLAVIKASAEEIDSVVSKVPPLLRADIEEQGVLTAPDHAFHAIVVSLWHVALAMEFGDSAIDTVANRIDEGKHTVASAYNLALVLGYKDVAARLLKYRLNSPKEFIRFRATERGTLQVHTPYNEEWNRIARESKHIFFAPPMKEGEFWWRTFHGSELRKVVNMLQGAYGDQLAFGTDDMLFSLPSMPLPKEDDFGKAPPKPSLKSTNETSTDETSGIRLGDTIQIPGGGTSIVQFIDPRKKNIGVGETKGGKYTFHSFEAIETINGKVIAGQVSKERKKAAAEVGQVAEDIVIDRVIPAGMKPYQIESVAFIEKHRRAILADEQGLGKSLVGITCIDQPAIIVCPATLKHNWVSELSKWRPELVVYVVVGSEEPSIADRKRADVFIINYDIIQNHLSWLIPLGAVTLLADEAQYLKNLSVYWDPKLKRHVPAEKSPRRANAFYDLHLGIPKLLLLTGTPVMNRTKELFPLLHLCNKQEWNSQAEYHRRYCGAFEQDTPRGKVINANGRTNSEELHIRARRYMVRHTKDMVLTELPPKSRQSILVSLSEKWRRAYVQLTRDFLAWVYAHGGPERVMKASRAEALTRLTAMRRVSANGKVEAALDRIENHLESTGFRPLIVMGVHADALTAIGAGLDEMNVQFDKDVAKGEMPSISRKVRWAAVVGSTPMAKRARITESFQKDGDIDVLLFSIPLATGLTLTRSQDMLFLERLWRPADQVQAEDRIHRIGQVNTAQITYLDGVGTIDQKLGLMLMNKTDTAAAIIDGQDLTRDQSFFRVFGDMVGKDGRKIDSSKLKAVESLAELIDEAEMEAIDMAQSLDELVKARKEMERQKEQFRDAKIAKGVSFDQATAEAEAEIDDDIEDFAAKLRKKMTPNRYEQPAEMYPGHAADRLYYEKMKREQAGFDGMLDSMVVDSWDQPL